MPPKKKDDNKPAKVAIDKTFGMKNKKGGKGQKAVARLAQEASTAGKNKESMAKEKQRDQEAKAKLQEQKHNKEVADLFKPLQVQKVPFGVDPKTVLCQYYKAGHCEKGKKCKFSHDLNVGRKTEKIDLYTDARADTKEEDTMDKWNDAKLLEVVNSKHGNPKTTTDIVCKFFIDAIEEGKYGWFWTCPNGGEECKYVHALPPGFVLKSQKKKEKEDAANAATITIEEFLETERHKLPANLTPITKESFAVWKKNRLDKKEAAADAVNKAKQLTAQAGKSNGLSGRDLFTFNPDLAGESDDEDDGEDWDLTAYRARTEAEREEAERKRIESLGIAVGTMSVNGVGG